MDSVELLENRNKKLSKALEDLRQVSESLDIKDLNEAQCDIDKLLKNEIQILKSLQDSLDIGITSYTITIELISKNLLTIRESLKLLQQLKMDFDSDTDSLPDTVEMTSSSESDD